MGKELLLLELCFSQYLNYAALLYCLMSFYLEQKVIKHTHIGRQVKEVVKYVIISTYSI